MRLRLPVKLLFGRRLAACSLHQLSMYYYYLFPSLVATAACVTTSGSKGSFGRSAAQNNEATCTNGDFTRVTACFDKFVEWIRQLPLSCASWLAFTTFESTHLAPECGSSSYPVSMPGGHHKSDWHFQSVPSRLRFKPPLRLLSLIHPRQFTFTSPPSF